MQVQVDSECLEFREQLHEMLKRTAETVDAPSGNHVEFPLGGRLHEVVETWTFVAPFGAGDLVLERCDDLPARGFGDRGEFAELILGGLVPVVGGNAQIKSNSLHSGVLH